MNKLLQTIVTSYSINRWLVLLSLIFGLGVNGYGQVAIWTNPITGTNPNTSNPYTTGQTVVSNITVSGIGRGSGIAGTNATDRYNANGWGATFDGNDHYSFTLTPSSGFKIDFSSFVFVTQISPTNPPTTFQLRSSVDNYASNIGSVTSTGGSVSLSTSNYQGITSAITFRLYAFGGSSATATFSVNSFTFNGTVSSAAAAPTIDFTAFTTSQTYGNSDISLASTSNSGAAAVFTSSNTSVATISGSTLTIVGVGTATITASHAAGNGFGAGTATQAITVGPKNLTFSSFVFADKIYDRTLNANPNLGALVGRVGSDNVNATGAPIYNYPDNNIGTNKTITYNSGTYDLTGADASKYTITTPTGPFTGNVIPATLTVTGLTANNRQFQSGNTAITITGTPTLNGVLTGDVGNVSLTGTATGSVSTDAVENNKPVTLSGLTLSGTRSGNYTLSLPTNLTASITAAPTPVITVVNNLAALTTTYGTASGNTSFTVSGTDISGGIQVTPPVGYQVSTTSDFSSNVGTNASPLTVGGNGTVGTTTIFVRFSSTATAGTYTGGTIAIASSAATTQNILIPASTVNTKALTISGVTTSDRVYNASAVATLTTGTLVGVVSGDEANVTLTQGSGAFANANIGTNKSVTISGFSISGTKAANYSLTQPSSLTASITAKNLTITGASATNRTFASGNTTVTVGGSLVGIEGSDIITLTGSVATDAIGAGKAVTFALAGTNAGNYTLTQPSPQVTVNITAAPVVLYGDPITGTSPGQTQNFVSSTGTTVATNITGAGIRRGSGVTGNAGNDRYNLTSFNTSSIDTADYFEFRITPASGFQIDFTSFIYSFQSSGSGPNGGAFRSSLDNFASNIGTATVTQNTTVSNRTISLTDAAFQSISSPITFRFYAWGGSGTGSINDYSFSGIVSSIPLTPPVLTLKEGVATIANAGEVTFASGAQNVQATKTLTITNTGTTVLNIASITRTSGDAAFTVSGVPATVAANGTANFTLAFDRTTEGADRTATFTITSDNGGVANTTQTFTAKGTVTAPETTISASGTLVALNTTYGTASINTSFTVSGANIFGGIQVNPPAGFQVSTTADFSSNVGSNGSPITVGGNGTVATTTVFVRIPSTTIPGTYSGNIVLSSTNATNVNVATISSTVAVKALTITGLSVTSKVYNKNNGATITGTPSLVGVINGNTVTISGTPIGTFADVNVGTGKTVNITGLSLAGTDAGFYSLTAPSLTNGVITVKTLTVTGATAANKEYDANTTASVTGTLVGVESGDVVTLTGAFASNTVGNNKPVTLGITGSSAGNYTLTQPDPLPTANITAPVYPYIYRNDITGTDTYLQNPYTNGQYSDPNITVSGLTRGPGLTGATGGDRFSASGFPTGATIDPAQDYYEITITPNSGIKFNLTQFKFASQRSGAMSVALRSSLDNYTANLGAPTTGGSETNSTVSLGSSFFNLNTAITFRIYGFSAAAPGTTFSINSFEVIGTTYDENTTSGLPNQSIFESEITGTTPSSSNPYSAGQIVNANLTVEGIRRGTGLSSATGDDRFNATGWDQTGRNATDFFEFRITPNTGYLVNFQSFVYNGERSGAGPNNFQVYSSVDNYNTAIANVGSGEGAAVTVNLNTSTFKNITSEIRFRIYAWGGTGGNYSINNFQFNGAVVKLTGIFRTSGSGDFSNAATWQYSETDTDPVWYVSPVVPTSDATSIQVQENHNLTINAPATIQNLAVASGGTLTIGSGQSLTVNNGTGTDFNIAGSVVNNGSITIAEGANANFAANANYTHATNGSVVPAATWATSSTVTFSGITNTAPTGLGQTFGNVVWNNTGQSANINLDLGTNTTIAGNLSIVSTTGSDLILSGSNASAVTIIGNLNLNGGSLVLNNGSTGTDNISVAGNFNHNGGTLTSGSGNVANLNIAGNFNIAASATIVPSTGLKFVMNGGSSANINNSNAATNLGLLEINKSAGNVVLNSSIAVNTIDFQSGNLDASGSGVNLTVNNSILNEGVGKKVIGRSITSVTITERGATEYAFNNAGLTLIFPANGGDLPGTISVTRITNQSVTGATGAGSVARRFNITASNNQNLNCTMKFSVLSDELNGLTASALNLSRSTNGGSSWITVARSGNVETVNNLSVVTATGINAFSDWTLEGDNAPLPVNLVSFTGKASHVGNELTWITASELNNKGFEVQRSVNGKDFTTFTFVNGKGTTNAKQTYTFTDAFGEDYYRLVQIDFDGKTTPSNVIFVGTKTSIQASIAPNPSIGAARLILSGSDNEVLTLSVISSNGKVVETLSGNAATLSETFYGISGQLKAGSYFVKVVGNTSVQTIKFIKQ